jgi:hypothetical protein
MSAGKTCVDPNKLKNLERMRPLKIGNRFVLEKVGKAESSKNLVHQSRVFVS